MPRKKVTSAVGGLSIKAVVDYFRKADMQVAEAALELATGEVKDRKAKAAQLSKAHKPAAVPAAGATGQAQAADAPARKKPGPPKGRKRNQANGTGENTGTNLPPQTAERAEAVSDLPLAGEGAVDVD